MNGCEQLHRLLEVAPLIRYPYAPDSLPESAVYFMYEDGQTWGHGGDQPRIVQVGTQRDGNFRKRLAEHYLPDDSRLELNSNSIAPKDRSILRKMIGRAILSRDSNPYLSVWNLDFTTRKTRDLHVANRDLEVEAAIEREVSEVIQRTFSFRYVEITDEKVRMGSTALTRKLIATVATCGSCQPTQDWLGLYSPVERIREFGLWQVHHVDGQAAEPEEM
jgi:hypothetical protein